LLRKNPENIIKGTSKGEDNAVAIAGLGANEDKNVPKEEAEIATIMITITHIMYSAPPGYKFVIQ
jgi:hypothetical protein